MIGIRALAQWTAERRRLNSIIAQMDNWVEEQLVAVAATAPPLPPDVDQAGLERWAEATAAHLEEGIAAVNRAAAARLTAAKAAAVTLAVEGHTDLIAAQLPTPEEVFGAGAIEG